MSSSKIPKYEASSSESNPPNLDRKDSQDYHPVRKSARVRKHVNLSKPDSSLRKRAEKQKVVSKASPMVEAPGQSHLLSSKDPTEKNWSCLEKRRFVEGLKTYGPESFKLIANLVGSRTEVQVEEKINKIRGSMLFESNSKSPCDSKKKDQAPIERWIQTVDQLIMAYDSIDYSEQISNVLGYIAKHEEFEESNVPDLSWRNIYTFLQKLSDNKTVEFPKLSDTESFVLLELMSDLGKELHESESSRQRQILENKYQLINNGLSQASLSRAEKTFCTKLLGQAFCNDFTGLEELLGPSATQPFTDLGIQSTGSAVQCINKADPNNSQPNFCPEQKDVPSCSTPASTDEDAVSPPSPLKPWNIQGERIPSSEVDKNQHVPLRSSAGLDSVFVKPKYFTLNPLGIPPELLDFQKK